MKICKGCGLKLKNDRFTPDKRTLDKLSPKCLSCRGLAGVNDTEKACLMCEVVKPLSDFHKDLQSPDLHRRICKKCGSKSAKAWNQSNPEKFNANQRAWHRAHRDASRASARKHHLKRTYGMTDVEYWELFEKQGRCCAICLTPPRTRHLHVDHNHKTGEVRGLLCSSCNSRLLPIIEHHPDRIDRALAYLSSPPFRSDDEKEALPS